MPAFRGPDGRVVYVPEEEASRYRAGTDYQEIGGAAAGAAQSKIAPTDNGVLGSIGATVSGALSGATLGASDWLLKGVLDKGQFEQLAQDRADNPVLSGTAQAAGMILPALASGGAATPAGALGRLAGEGIEAGRATGGALGLAQQLGAAGAEGAIGNAGIYLSDVALGDRDLTAEGINGALGTGLLFGAAGIPVSHGIEAGTIAARRLFARYAQGGAQAASDAAAAWTEQAQKHLEGFDQAADLAKAKLAEAQTAREAANLQRLRAQAEMADARAFQPPPEFPGGPAGATGGAAEPGAAGGHTGANPAPVPAVPGAPVPGESADVATARALRDRAAAMGGEPITPEEIAALEAKIGKRTYSSRPAAPATTAAPNALEALAQQPGVTTRGPDTLVAAGAGARVPVTADEAELGSRLSEYQAARRAFDDLHAQVDPDLDAILRGVQPGDIQRPPVPVGEFGAPGARGVKSQDTLARIAAGTGREEVAAAAQADVTGAGGPRALRSQGTPPARSLGEVAAEQSPVPIEQPATAVGKRPAQAAAAAPSVAEPSAIANEGEFRAMQRDLREKLTPEEIKQSIRFSREYYMDVNRALRGNRAPLDPEAAKEITPVLDRVMDKAVADRPIVTHRGFPNTAGQDLSPGAILYDPGFSSTSWTDHKINRFGKVHLVITSPAGTHIAAIPSGAAEGELTLARGTSMRVTSRVEHPDGNVTVHATVVKQDKYGPIGEASAAKPAASAVPAGFDIRAHAEGGPIFSENPSVRTGVPKFGDLSRETFRDNAYIVRPSELESPKLRGITSGDDMVTDARTARVREAWSKGERVPALEIDVDPKGHHFIADGNHRLLAAAADGDRPVLARFRPVEVEAGNMDRIGDDLARALGHGKTPPATGDDLLAALSGTKAALDKGTELANIGGAEAAATRAEQLLRHPDTAERFLARAGASDAAASFRARASGPDLDAFFRDLTAPKTRDAYVAAHIQRAMREEGNHAAALAKVEREWAERTTAELREERAAILEYEGGHSRAEAERMARDEVAHLTRGSGTESASAGEPVVWESRKNLKRVEAAKKAADASVERLREIHSAVASNLPQELQTAWKEEGYKFLRDESARVRGMKDRINAASKISEAFTEKYGSASETLRGYEGDRFYRRAEIEANHAESWAKEQERKYYASLERARTATDPAERAAAEQESQVIKRQLTQIRARGPGAAGAFDAAQAFRAHATEARAIAEPEVGDATMDRILAKHGLGEPPPVHEPASAMPAEPSAGHPPPAPRRTLTAIIKDEDARIAAGDPAAIAERARKDALLKKGLADFDARISAGEPRAVAARDWVERMREEARAAVAAGERSATAAGPVQTWREFQAERMAPYMKSEGSHAAAMKRISAEWRNLRSGEHPLATKQLEMAHDAALERAATAADPAERAAAVQEAKAIEKQITQVGARPGAVEDIAAIAPAMTRVEKAAAALTEALGDAAPAAAKEHAAAFRAAEDEASRKTTARIGQAADDAASARAAAANRDPLAPAPRAGEDLLGAPGPRQQKVAAAQKAQREAQAAYAKARVAEAEAQVGAKQAAGAAADARTKLGPPPGAPPSGPGMGHRIVQGAHMVGYAAELGSDLGIPGIPRPHDIPVIGPLLSAYLKYRALRAAAGRFVGRIPATAETHAAELAARTRDGVARAVDRSLGLIERNTNTVRVALTVGTLKATDALSKRLVDDGGPDAKAGASVSEQAAVRMRELAAVVANPSLIQDQIRAQTRGMTDPDLINALSNHLLNMFSYLNNVAPKGPPPNPFTGKAWTPPPGDAMRFGQQVAIAKDPQVAFQMLAAGTLTQAGADTLQNCYRLLFQEGQQRIMQRAAELKSPVAYPELLRLGRLFDVPLHPSLDPEHAAELAVAHTPTAKPAPAASPGGPPTPSIANPTNLSSLYDAGGDRRAGRM